MRQAHATLSLLTALLACMPVASCSTDEPFGVPDGRPRDPEGLEAQHDADQVIAQANSGSGDLETPDQFGRKPLYRAADTDGSFKALRRLLDAGAKIEGRDRYGRTALFAAFTARINHAHGSIQPAAEVHERVRVLLAAGADPNARDDQGRTPLMHARDSDDERIAMLLDAGARPDDRDDEGLTALMHMLKRGRANRLLLARTKDLEARDPNGRTALSLAADGAGAGAISDLVEAGARVETTDDRGWTPLMHAVEGRFGPESIETLIARGADPGRGGWTPLMLAARKRDLLEVKKLILDRADVRARDRHGRTALHWAAASVGAPNIIDALLRAHAPVDAADEAGLTPLHVAARCGYPDVLATLLDAGADVNARERSARTPLMFALAPNLKDNAALLLDRGADLNAQDDAGLTPLMLAAVEPGDEVLRFLLARGARLDPRDRDGRTAFDHAKTAFPREALRSGMLDPR